MTLLPSTLAVVEVLESVPSDDLVMAALQRLKQAGYVIALDDFTLNDHRAPLTDFADILKVDLRQTSMDEGASIGRKYGPWRCRLVAEKVETREEFSAAKAAGFVYFSRLLLPPAGSSSCQRDSRKWPELFASFARRLST
jgi:c-di-GMP-related signal transduction protein